MNELLSQLVSLSPALVQGARGNGNGMQAFLDAYQRTSAQLDQRARQQQADQIALEDRQRAITQQTTTNERLKQADARATEDQDWQNTQRVLESLKALQGIGASAETPEQGEAMVDSAYSAIPANVRGQLAPMRDQAIAGIAPAITARQKRQVAEFVGQAVKTSYVAENPNADPEITNLPAHIQKVIGKPVAKLSELQVYAELPVGKPGKEPTPRQAPMAGSFEDFVTRKYGDKATPEQIIAARKVYTDAGREPEKTSAEEAIAPDDVAGAAQAILAGRMAPSQLSLVGGMGSRGVKFKQAVVAEVNKQNPAFNWQQAESGYQFGKSPATQTTVRYLDNVSKTIPMLRDANKVFKRSNVQFVNDVIKSGKKQFGNVDVADFDFKNTLLADEIAKVLQGGGTGSGTSDAKLRQAQDLLNGRMTPAQYDAVLDAADEMLKVRRDTLTKGTFMEGAGQQPAAPKFQVGQKVRNKATGEIREVTGVRPDGAPILGPVVKQ